VNNGHAVERAWLMERVDELVDLAGLQRNGEIAARLHAVTLEANGGGPVEAARVAEVRSAP
jgi:hypothetical protein